MSYTVTINSGTAQSFESLNLSFTGLNLLNFQTDKASLKWERAAVSEECPLAHNDVVEIFLGSTRLFYGRARLGTITAQGASLFIFGPWSYADETTSHVSLYSGSVGGVLGKRVGDSFAVVYPAGSGILKTDGTTYIVPAGPDLTVTWTVTTGPYTYTAAATTGNLDVNYMWSSKHWLFKPGGTVGEVYTTLADELDLRLDFMDHIFATDPWTRDVASLGSTVVPKIRTISDMKMSEVLRQVCAMKPDMAAWFGYASTGVPTLNFRVASAETAVTIPIGTADGHALTDYQLTEVTDLRPTGVLISWEDAADDTTGVAQPLNVDKYPSTTDRLQPGVLLHTVDLDQPYVSGLAQQIYDSLSVRRAQGTVNIYDPTFSLGLRPGLTIYLTGDPELTDVQLWVQAVSWSPETGIAALQVGYPAHLGLRDLVDLRGWLRWTFYGPHWTTTQVIPAP